MIAAPILLALVAAPQDAAQTAGAELRPRPTGQPQNWVTDDNYPAISLRNREFGTVKFRIEVDAKGKPASCHITGTSGYSALDDKVCEMMLKRAIFIPGRDAAGVDRASPFNGSFNWVIPGGPRQNPISAIAATPADVTVNLQAVPKSYANPALLRLVFDDDKVKACTVERTSGNPKLDAIACQQVSAQLGPMEPIKGIPKPNSRMATVTFEGTK